jgi:plasmid stabilization system protein ParE
VTAVKVIWTPGAVRDLEQIHAYIAADTPRYADVVAARIVEAFERLADFPPDASFPNWAAAMFGN